MSATKTPKPAARRCFCYGSVAHRISVLKSAREYREGRRLYLGYYEPTPFERLAHLEQIIKEGKFHG
jgi:hypothetical protein